MNVFFIILETDDVQHHSAPCKYGAIKMLYFVFYYYYYFAAPGSETVTLYCVDNFPKCATRRRDLFIH